MNKRGLLVAIFGLITLTAAGDESAHRNRPREFMKKKIVIFLMLTSVLNLVSCVVICSSKSNMYIVNNTEDTLLICCAYYAEFDEIDSVDYFLPAEWDVSLEGDTKLGRDGKLKISNKNLIPPDSAGNYCRTLLSYGPRLGNDNDEKGYFFILKLEVAQSYTWKEIRNERLYDTLVISREMLGKNKNRRFLIERGITGTVPVSTFSRNNFEIRRNVVIFAS